MTVPGLYRWKSNFRVVEGQEEEVCGRGKELPEFSSLQERDGAWGQRLNPHFNLGKGKKQLNWIPDVAPRRPPLPTPPRPQHTGIRCLMLNLFLPHNPS